MDFDGKKSGQIPAFGDWDNANELPITQYFESARQAGLVRYASPYNTDQCDPYMMTARGSSGGGGGGGSFPVDLYSADFQKPSQLRVVAVPPRKTGAVNGGQSNMRRCGCPPHMKEQQRIKQVKVYEVVDVKQQARSAARPRTRSQQLLYNQTQKQQFPKHSADGPSIIITHRPTTAATANVKPVDEDLYKIPPELLLQNSKRKKMLGFFSKCLAPPCKA